MLPKFVSNPDPRIYLEGKSLVLDLETTNIEKGDARYDNRIVCAASKLGGGKIQYHPSDSILETVSKGDYDFIVAHNAKFELKYFIKCGIDVSSILVYDTLLSEKVIISNRNKPLDLGSVSLRYGGTAKEYLVDLLMKGKVCPSEMPESLLRRRVIKDVYDTEFIFKRQVEALRSSGALNVAYTKNVFCPVVADMEMNGMFLDKDLAKTLSREDNRQLLDILEQLDEISGGINWNSPKQVSKFLYEDAGFDIPQVRRQPLLNKNGSGKTDATTLALLKPKNKRQRNILDLISRHHKTGKRVSTYHNKFEEYIEGNDCLMWGSINQATTATQRLSSSSPNLQNIDRTLKKVVTARHDGWMTRQNDYAQMEFRMAAFLAQDEQALIDINNGEDVHSNTATVLFDEYAGLALDNPKRGKLRTAAKADTFKPLFGGESGTPKQRKYYEFFRRRYAGISAWHRKLMAEAASTGKVVARTGLIFHFPNTTYQQNGNVTGHTKIKNYNVQYMATGETAVIGTFMLWHQMKSHKLKSLLVNEVHDSVVIEQHPDEHDILTELSEKAMVTDTLQYMRDLYGIDINYPVAIDQEVHTNWGYNRECA